MIAFLVAACSSAPATTGAPHGVADVPAAAGDGQRQRGGNGRERAGDRNGDRNGERNGDPQEAAGPIDPVAAGLVQQVVEGGPEIGGRRTAWVHVPANAKGPMPVVIAFHGGHSNNGLDMAPRLEGGFDHPVLFVFPDGDPANPKEVGWVGPGTPDAPDEMKDVHFVQALIESLAKTYDIDRTRLYAVGFSNGGFMTHTLFCKSNATFAGYAIVSRPLAITVQAVCDDTQPKPFFFAAGTADDKMVNDHEIGIDGTVAYYVDKLQCKPDKKTTDTLPDKGDRTTVERTVWKDCAKKVSMEYYKIEGGGHYWPGPVGRPLPGKSLDLDATAEILRFFDL